MAGWGDEDECPSSPKVAPRKRRSKEKKAMDQEIEDGDRMYVPQSYKSGLLLLRGDGSFSYVHDRAAKFSEGVQGKWEEASETSVTLDPKNFGYCYEGIFDPSEILGVCHTVTLLTDICDESGKLVCTFPNEIVTFHSWLDPTQQEEEKPAFKEEDMANEEFCPCSPKILGRSRKNRERRVNAYKALEGERLYRPESVANGVLLIRPDGTFAYVHDNEARFSEGVEGKWKQELDNKVRLIPKEIGYCYEDSFDASEVVGVCHTITLSDKEDEDTGRLLCTLPAELLEKFSWLDPNRPEGSDDAALVEDAFTDECPLSPKVPNRSRKNAEKRVKQYKPLDGERLYAPESRAIGCLLLRPDNSFSYVHDVAVRFSEGVSGDWTEDGEKKVKLEPTSFGYCYSEYAEEIVGVCLTVALFDDKKYDDGKMVCTIPEEALGKFSWLDPTHEVEEEK